MMAGEADMHVFNVLYGAQESQGYERDLNVHYFGYTPAVARAMAELAGLEDVEIETFKDSPDLNYNMIIRGVKPKGDETPEEEDPSPCKTDTEVVDELRKSVGDVVEVRPLPELDEIY